MRSLLKIIAVLFLIGGVLGLIKGFFPQTECMSFRYLLGAGATYQSGSIPLIARVYGIVMAIIEVTMAIFLFSPSVKSLKFALVVVCINATGCVIATVMGDGFAIISLVARVLVILLLLHVYRQKQINADHVVCEGKQSNGN